MLTLLVVAKKEYQTSGLVPPPPPVPQGLVIVEYVAATKVPDVLIQLEPCVRVIAAPQLSLDGCANKISGIQINRKAKRKIRIGDRNLIRLDLVCSRTGFFTFC